MEAVVLLAAVGFTLVLALGVWSFVRERKRRDALATLAARRGWSFTGRDDRWCEAFGGSPFGQGHNRQARNVLTGTHEGRPLVAFDFVYHTTETDRDAEGHTRTREVAHAFAVTALGMGATVPRLSVSPEGFFGRALGKLLGNDIELESEEFNRAFKVTSEDRKFAYDVLHPRLMEYLLTVRDVAWRTTNGHLVSVEPGHHQPDGVEPRVAVLARILDSLPEFVRRQHGLPGPAPAAERGRE